MEIIVRQMLSNDAGRVAELSGELGYPTSPETMELRISRLSGRIDHLLLVVCEKSKQSMILGWIHVRINESLELDSHAEIVALIVAQNSRGLRIGQKLVDAAEDWCLPLVSVITLKSQTIRTDAHRFYQRLNYQIMKSSYMFSKTIS